MTGSSVGVIDIGASKVLVGFADSTGEIATGCVERFATPDTPEELVRRVSDYYRRAGDKSLSVIGCAAPGPLDTASGVVLSMHNRNWVNVPLGELLSSALGAPVRLEDDANAAAVGEASAGAGRGHDPVVYLTVSSGVGAGVVVGGKPLRGASGLAGEIGHLVIDPEGPLCGCGRHGDVESFAGGHSLARLAASVWPEDHLRDGTSAPRTAEAVFMLARRGDQEAIDLVEAATAALAVAVAAIACVVEPAVVVLGGSIGLADPEWMDRVAAQARARCMPQIAANLRVVPAALGQLSGLAGVAVLALGG
jgi:glucokinase